MFRVYNAGLTIDVVDVWPETRKDLTAVQWAREVNQEGDFTHQFKAALWGRLGKLHTCAARAYVYVCS